MSERTTPDSYFEGDTADKFKQYELSTAGHIRYKLTHRNLAPFLTDIQLHIADIGGGSGVDALWYAQLGHTVVLAEPAKDNRRYARQRFDPLPTAIQDKVTIIDATSKDLLKTGQQFDMVTSHGVAMYLDDPQDFIHDLGKLTKTGGYISLLEKGFYGKDSSLRKTGNSHALQQLHDTGWTDSNNVGKRSYAFKPEELEQLLLQQAGAQILQWSGVRIAEYDKNMRAADISDTLREITIESEAREGASPGIRRFGKMLHFIAQKQT